MTYLPRTSPVWLPSPTSDGIADKSGLRHSYIPRGKEQALWALGGLLFGPLALLGLYLKLRRSSDIPEL